MGSTTPTDNAAWRLELFADRAGGATRAAIMSADGRVLTSNHVANADSSQQLTVMAAGIMSLARAAALFTISGNVRQTIIDLADAGLLVIIPLDRGEHLIVLTAATDREQFGFDVCRLVEQLDQARWAHKPPRC